MKRLHLGILAAALSLGIRAASAQVFPVQMGASPGGSGSGVSSFNSRTGAVVPASSDYAFSQVSGSVTLAQLPTLAADSVYINNTGSTAIPSTLALPSCSSAASALTYNATTHALGCNTISGSGTVNSGTAGQLGYYATSSTAISGNANATISSGALTLGQTGSVIGNLILAGNTSGAITIKPQAAAGTYNWNLPTGAGNSGDCLTSGGGGSTPMAWASCGGGSGPSGSGSEVQYRAGSSSFGAVTSASSSMGINLGSAVAPVEALNFDQVNAAWWNTTDHVTNYDKASIGFNSNNFSISTTKAGTGVARQIKVDSGVGMTLNVATGNTIFLAVNNSAIFSMGSSAINAGNAAGPAILNAGASATVPTFAPNKTSNTTGFGAQAAGNISAIIAGAELVRWTAGGVKYVGTAPTPTGTGTPTITSGSTDTSGEVTAGASATSVVITFAASKTNAPFCAVTSQTQLAAFAYTISTTAITITQTATSGNKIDYVCTQN